MELETSVTPAHATGRSASVTAHFTSTMTPEQAAHACAWALCESPIAQGIIARDRRASKPWLIASWVTAAVFVATLILFDGLGVGTAWNVIPFGMWLGVMMWCVLRWFDLAHGRDYANVHQPLLRTYRARARRAARRGDTRSHVSLDAQGIILTHDDTVRNVPWERVRLVGRVHGTIVVQSDRKDGTEDEPLLLRMDDLESTPDGQQLLAQLDEQVECLGLSEEAMMLGYLQCAHGRCPDCGCELHALSAARCPACARPLGAADLPEAFARARSPNATSPA